MTSLSLFVVLFTVLFKSEAAVPGDCDLISTTTIPVYYNWPVSLNCDEFLWDVFYADIYDDGTQSIIFNCTITALPSGDVVLQSSTEVGYDEDDEEYTHPDRDAFIFTMDEVKNFTQTTYEMVLTYQVSGESDVVCNAREIILNATDLVQQTCDDNLLTAESIDMVHNIRGKEVGDTTSVLCDVLSTFPGPKKLVDEDKAETHWLYNCGSELPSNTAEDHRHKHGILLTNISYQENPGVYTCVVEYRDQIRYRIHHRICVKDQISQKLTLSCPDYKAIVGQDVEIECHVDAGLGHENELVFDSHFHKLDGGSRDINVENSSCGAFADRNDTIVNDRFSCSLVTSNIGNNKCFSNPPTEEEYQSQKTFLKMFYKIKNVQASDFGVYVATMLRLQHAFNTTFTLEEDLAPTLKRSTLAIVISISVLVGIGIIIFLLIYFYRLEMTWFWKHHFGPTEKETKQYAGYLAYYYSTDMRETSSVDLGNFVEALEKRIYRLGGNLYDKCRDHTGKQYIAQNIHAKLTECHRVIIILTPEYIQDQWSVYETNEALKNVIEQGIPIIFVTFPSTKSTIESMPFESQNALKKALKRHGVIKWNGKLPFSCRLMMKLDLLMPKLPRDGNMELSKNGHVYENSDASKMQDSNGNWNEKKNFDDNVV